ncbi:hypothetical protein LCGC14_1071800 [marine sediment metagenome]|uniref:Uncharacterized protein n=1 Tax=marine sediment metagenome TaxID=412755 RepID=A0A0F9MHZ8_9ZZZZ
MMAKKNRRCKKCTENKNFGFCDDKRCSNPPVSTMKTPTLRKEEEEEIYNLIYEEFGEVGKVHKINNFIATIKHNAVKAERCSHCKNNFEHHHWKIGQRGKMFHLLCLNKAKYKNPTDYIIKQLTPTHHE